MAENNIYEVEIVSVVNEAKNEFKPVLGKDVEKEDKKNSKSFFDEVIAQIERESPKSERKKGEIRRDFDWNRGLLDYDWNEMGEPSDEWKERAIANAHGYPSADNEKSTTAKNNGGVSFEGNKGITKDMEDRSERRKERQRQSAQAGLRGHNLKANTQKKHQSPMNEGMKRIRFKKEFLNEQDVINSVPKEFVKDGNRFYMTDATGTDYLMECRFETAEKVPMMYILSETNENVLNEELDRIKSLINYDTKSSMNKNYFVK